MLLRCLIAGILLVAGLLALPRDANAQYVVRCESIDFRQSHCPVDTGGGVRIVRQISESDCYEGETWGYDRRGIWVTEGCAGEFEILGRGHGRPEYGQGHQGRGRYRQPAHRGATIVCESRDFHYNYCAVRVRRGANIVEQYSRTECLEGRTWGWDRGGVWVDQGCAAAFNVY